MGVVALPGSREECGSKSEGHQTEADLSRPPAANGHPALLLPLVPQQVTPQMLMDSDPDGNSGL